MQENKKRPAKANWPAQGEAVHGAGSQSAEITGETCTRARRFFDEITPRRAYCSGTVTPEVAATLAWLTSEEPASLPAECVIKVAGDRITGRKPEEVTA
ncbi:MAG: hypothetical protein IPO18_11470 [bacterium]|nr:hypothetical protein [bacterium]